MNGRETTDHGIQDLLRELSARIDGELPPERSSAIDARLQSDGDLRQARDEFQVLDALLEHWPVPPAGDVRSTVMTRVRRDLAQAEASRARRRRWTGVAWAASWVMGGMMTGLSLWAGINHEARESCAAETMAQDMTMSMLMTEDWTPPIAIEEEYL